MSELWSETTVQVWNDGRAIMKISKDGVVSFGDHLTPDGAAKAAWEILVNMAAVHNKSVASREWQPIETAPKDGTEVLAFVGPSYQGGVLILQWYKENGFEAWRDWDHDIWNPSHWMPLPEPPK